MQESILTFKPSIKSIAFGIVGTAIFGSLVNVMLTSEWNVSEGTDETSGKVIMWVLTLIFGFFCFASFISVLNSKLIRLSNKELRIIKPFVFLHKSILISDIKKLSQENYYIKSSHGSTNIDVYNGLQTIVELRNGKKIKLNSFESTDYNKLNLELKRLISPNKSGEIREISTKDKWNGFGWLLFTILTLGILIWAFLTN